MDSKLKHRDVLEFLKEAGSLRFFTIGKGNVHGRVKKFQEEETSTEAHQAFEVQRWHKCISCDGDSLDLCIEEELLLQPGQFTASLMLISFGTAHCAN